MSILSQPYFHSEAAAYEFVESKLWPSGAKCPKCGEIERVSKMQGASTRVGVYKCYACRKPFTVKVGTIFESSHIKLNLWLQAIFLVASSKKGISANQLHRTLGITLKSAWFLGHRIREAMQAKGLAMFGENGGFVEVDETYMQKIRGLGKGGHVGKKRKVVALVDRNSMQVRTEVVDRVDVPTIKAILETNMSKSSQLMTDKAGVYLKIGKEFAAHHSVDHGKGELFFNV
jgi:transposase-like protein